MAKSPRVKAGAFKEFRPRTRKSPCGSRLTWLPAG